MWLCACSHDHRYLHVLTHSFPTRHSSDLWLGIECPQGNLESVPAPGIQMPQSGRHSRQARVPAGSCNGSTHARCGYAWVASTRSEEHTSELQSLMRISYADFCLKKQNDKYQCNKRIKKYSRNKSTI